MNSYMTVIEKKNNTELSTTETPVQSFLLNISSPRKKDQTRECTISSFQETFVCLHVSELQSRWTGTVRDKMQINKSTPRWPGNGLV